MYRIERCLPAWVLGVAASFALPAVPAWYVTAAVGTGLLLVARRSGVAVVLLAALLGMAYGIWRTELALANQWPVGRFAADTLTLKVTGLPQREERRVRFEAQVQDAGGRQRRVQLSDYSLRDWPVGSVWRANVRLRAPVGEVNLRGFNREAWALANGLDALGTVGKAREQVGQEPAGGVLGLRAAISGNWQQVQGFEQGVALMRALSIGEQGALPNRAWQAFRPLGLTHLVSISGLHVSMVGLMAAWLARLVLRRLPFSFKRPRTVVLAAGLAAACLYALLAGFGVPTQRTVLMLAAFAWIWHSRKGQSVWFAWWAALSAVLLFDPLAVLGVGTWLSFGLVAALLWISAWRLEEKGWRVFWRGQYALLLVSLVALGFMFAALPLISPLVNLLAVPWFSWVLVPLALAASAFPFIPLQTFAAGAGQYTMHALFWLGDRAPEWSVAAAPAGLLWLAAAAVSAALLPRGMGLRPWAFIVLAGFVFYRPPAVPHGAVKITVWDVGQGLAVSFHTASKTLLFDTGTEAAAQTQLIPSLRAMGVRRLDAAVFSHHDNDHDGGAELIRQAFSPTVVWAGQPGFYPNARLCHEGKAWNWDGVHFEWLSLSEKSDDDNEQSCILRVVAAEKALLVTGDLSRRGEQLLVGQYGEDLYSHVLVLGHHGSNSASSSAFLNVVAPQYAIASSGFANAYGHPAEAVKNRLRAHGIRLMRTDLHGVQQFWFAKKEERSSDSEPDSSKPYWQKKPFKHE